MNQRLFRSSFLAGFECSSHRLRSRRRLDVLAATAHDHFVRRDYLRLLQRGIRTAREGVRWHRVETSPGVYDFATLLPMVHAARDLGVQVVWDLCHYGWPDDLDVFSPDFVRRFAAYARAVARAITEESDHPLWVTPINEISFFAWAGGGCGYFHPHQKRRGDELKKQLVRAAIAGIEAVWEIAPQTRIAHVDPVIHIAAHPARPAQRAAAARHTRSQFHAWDALAGRRWPELGGDPKYLDVVGVNYYWNNQWFHRGRPIPRRHPLHRPFRELLGEVYRRYRRPLFVAETGIEGRERPRWLRYIGREVRAAIRDGIPVEGVCLYPILDYPGWDDGRHCASGLWGYADTEGDRPIYQPLADELLRQQRLLSRLELQPAILQPLAEPAHPSALTALLPP